jgi:HAD superfamily hydrolase (TIGR01458 family)
MGDPLFRQDVADVERDFRFADAEIVVEKLEAAGLLVDVDGVLRIDDTPIPGAAEALVRLRRAGLGLRFLTNTSVRSRASLLRNLNALGLGIGEGELFTAAFATAEYLRATGKRRIFLLVKGDVVEDFADFELTDRDAEAVVISGAEEQFTYEKMNRAFQLINAGADLVAIHRNTWWMTERGPWLDAGAYVTALEHATGKNATLIGKPSPKFFELAMRDLGLPAERILVVGDDVGADIGGGHAIGCRTVLVRTGKFRLADLERAEAAPDLVLDSIANVPGHVILTSATSDG